jgi:hypothetical protein
MARTRRAIPASSIDRSGALGSAEARPAEMAVIANAATAVARDREIHKMILFTLSIVASPTIELIDGCLRLRTGARRQATQGPLDRIDSRGVR